MIRLIYLPLLACAALVSVPAASDAGLLHHAGAGHHHHACYHSANGCDVALPAAAPSCCAAESCLPTTSCRKHGCRPKHLRKALKHARCNPGCLPATPACATPACNTNGYGMLPYGYGIPADGPHWF